LVQDGKAGDTKSRCQSFQPSIGLGRPFRRAERCRQLVKLIAAPDAGL